MGPPTCTAAIAAGWQKTCYAPRCRADVEKVAQGWRARTSIATQGFGTWQAGIANRWGCVRSSRRECKRHRDRRPIGYVVLDAARKHSGHSPMTDSLDPCLGSFAATKNTSKVSIAYSCFAISISLRSSAISVDSCPCFFSTQLLIFAAATLGREPFTTFV